MELNNEIHTEHEHAAVSLKVVLLVFAIVLVGALGYLVWAQNTAPDTTDNSVLKTTTTSKTAGWKTYTDTSNHISFMYPKEIPSPSLIDPPGGSYSMYVDFEETDSTQSDGLGYAVENKAFKKENISGVYMQNGVGAIETSVAGQTAYYYEEGDAGMSQTVYAFPNKDKTKILRLFFTRDSESNQKKVVTPAIQTILSTVKYLD